MVKWVANDDWLQESCVHKKEDCEGCKRVQIAHECVYAVSSHYSAVEDTVYYGYTLSHVSTLCSGKWHKLTSDDWSHAVAEVL